MFLTATNVLPYLQEVGLTSPDEIVAGGISLFECGRRNRNFHIFRQGARSLFVKQVPAMVAETALSFSREAACGQLASEAGETSSLPHIMPKLRYYDPKRQVLAFEAFDQAESALEVAMRTGDFSAEYGGSLAGTLAAFHRETMRPGALARIASVLNGEAPWIFSIGEKAETIMPGMSGGTRQAVESIRQAPELYHGLAQLGRQWQHICLIHGDLKWDNLLLVQTEAGARELRVIDWELANLGDPMWDVAGALSAYLQFWMLHQPMPEAAQATPAALGRAVPIAFVHERAPRFWQAYVEAIEPSLPVARNVALRAVWLTGARLALTAFELVAKASELSYHARLALQLARYFMADPDRAAADLLGIHLSAERVAAPPGNPEPRDATPWKLPALTPVIP